MAKERFELSDGVQDLLSGMGKLSAEMKDNSAKAMEYAQSMDKLAKQNTELTKLNDALSISFSKVSNALNKASSGNDLTKYIKSQEDMIKSIGRTYRRYSRESDEIKKNNLSEELYKEVNALKAVADKTDLSELISNFEDVKTAISSVSSYIKSEFSVSAFKEINETIEVLEQAGLKIRNVFSTLDKGSQFYDIDRELRETKEQLDLINNADISELTRKLEKLSRIAEDEFNTFLNLYNLSGNGYKFYDIFEEIRSGALTSQQAIERVKNEFDYLLIEAKSSGNQHYDILNSSVIREMVENISTLHIKIDEIITKISGVPTENYSLELFDEEQFNRLLILFEKIESSLSSMKAVFVDVGDGEEFSPLLSTIDKINTSISELSTSVKGIGLNMNIDVGSDSEAEAKVQSKISNALQAYQRLFDHIKMSGAGGSIVNTSFFEFDINQYDTMMAKLQAYKKFIDNMRKEAKTEYNGKDVLYQNTDKSYWSSASAAMGQVTRAFNEMNAASDTSPLENLFGKTDLSEVISQLELVVGKLDEISTTASSFIDLFSNGLNVNSSIEEIEKLTNRVKELEDELSNIKINPVVDGNKSNISSGNETKRLSDIDNQDTSSIDKVTNSLVEEQKAVGELEMVFRGLEGSLNGFISNSGRLATFFTTSPILARQYADELGGVYQAMVALGKSLDINGEGYNWNEIEYLGDGSDETSKKIQGLKDQIIALRDTLIATNSDGTGLSGKFENYYNGYTKMIQCFGDAGIEYNSYVEAIEKGNLIERQQNETVKQLMIQLYELEKAYKAISDAKDNVYGTHTTDEFAELAKLNGYDSVMFRNIRDGLAFNNIPTDVGVIFDESQVDSVKNVSDHLDDLIEKIDRIKASGYNLPINIELPKEISRLKDGNFVNNLTGEIYEDLQKALEDLKELDAQFDSTIEDVFQNDSDSSSTAKEEVSAMEQVESATEQAVQAKKDFATANEGVQDSVADSKSPLQLEAELMQQIAKDARDAADAKKEFVEANKQVKDSADDSNGSVKKDKYKNRKKISEDDYTSRYSDFASIANKTLTDNGNAILGNSVSTELVNGLVKVSAKIKTVDGDWKTFSAKIDADGNMFEQRFNTITKGVNKLNSELENFGKDTVSTPKSDTQKSVDKALNQQISAWKKLESIREETEKNDPKNEKRIAELEEIKELYQKQYDEAKNILDANQDLYNVEKQTEQLKQVQLETDAKISKYRATQKDSTVSSFQSSIDSYQSKLTKYNNRPKEKQSVEYQNLLTEYESQLARLRERAKELSEEEIISKDQINSFNELKGQLDTTDLKFQNVFKGDDLITVKKEIDTITQYMSKNTRISSEAKDKLRGYIEELKTKGADANVKAIHAAFLDVCDGERKAKREGQSFLDVLRDKVWFQWAAQIGSYFSLNDIIRYAKEGIQTVRELDTALVEMRKVSDESVQSLKNYQATTFDVADAVGTTAVQIQNSTADFMRLGESIDSAAESSRVANILLNVSEFDSISDATDSLVAMGQAYKDLDKIEIVDKLNEVGNNYAISTDELASALQKSAATLSLMGNSIDEAAALITTANSVLMDADSVSAGMRTISLRIVGTEQAEEELSALNEEVDEFVKATNSKKQQIIKDYTAVASNNYKGFDILDENGNYKNTYDILLGISKIYKEIQEEDKKLGTNRAVALVEELAGKNRSNVASAILSDPKQLEAVKKSSEEAFGSAEEELNKYLDSVDGKLAQLSNRAQEFWATTINSELIKDGIDLLTALVGGATDLIDTIGTLPALLTTIGGALAFKNIGRPKMFGLVLKYADNHKCSLGY